MSSRFGPIEVQCDAPSYQVVKASQRVGIQNPEDVRWLRLGQFLRQPVTWKGLFHPATWKQLFGGKVEKTCSCGQRLPRTERVTFTCGPAGEWTYRLGQCRRCSTVFWDEV